MGELNSLHIHPDYDGHWEYDAKESPMPFHRAPGQWLGIGTQPQRTRAGDVVAFVGLHDVDNPLYGNYFYDPEMKIKADSHFVASGKDGNPNWLEIKKVGKGWNDEK